MAWAMIQLRERSWALASRSAAARSCAGRVIAIRAKGLRLGIFSNTDYARGRPFPQARQPPTLLVIGARAVRAIITPYTGGWRREPGPRPKARAFCIFSEPPYIINVNIVQSSRRRAWRGRRDRK